MAVRSYRKTLQDPRWQRKRLAVLERAGWRCEWCGNGKENLQVHHGYYGGKEREAWEVPDEVLYCLCDSCHERAEVAKKALYLELGRIHPRHHWHVRALLKQVQDLVAEDEKLLRQVAIERS